MGNGVPEAKAAADLITTTSSNHGILNGLIQVGLLGKDADAEYANEVI